MSVDGLFSVDTEATLKFIYSRLTTKWKQPYLQTFVYVKSRVYITLVRATHFYIQVSWVIAYKISVKIPQWDDGAVLHLFL